MPRFRESHFQTLGVTKRVTQLLIIICIACQSCPGVETFLQGKKKQALWSLWRDGGQSHVDVPRGNKIIEAGKGASASFYSPKPSTLHFCRSKRNEPSGFWRDGGQSVECSWGNRSIEAGKEASTLVPTNSYGFRGTESTEFSCRPTADNTLYTIDHDELTT